MGGYSVTETVDGITDMTEAWSSLIARPLSNLEASGESTGFAGWDISPADRGDDAG